ncbi:ester cyclase [Streptomyces sp. NPDC102406]|uniref:ester cyclase n=1 Tax=Streptomyces sp. NPDC102406 TaxID=3366171 RepID=UPI0038198BF3
MTLLDSSDCPGSLDAARMLKLAHGLAVAKSRQDVAAAMRYLHHDMTLEAPAFGTAAHGPEANRAALTSFFTSFPDYEIALEGHAVGTGALVCWGTALMTMTGDRFGVTPNGRQARLPVFIRFGFRDGLIASERFCFDLAELCAQSGVSTDTVRATLSGQGSGGGR